MAANLWSPSPTRAFYSGGVCKQKRFAVRGAAGVANQASTAGTVPALGVFRTDADAAGQEVDLFVTPGSAVPLEAGAAFVVGDQLTFDNQGRAIKATAGMYICAIADEAAGAAGRIAVATLVSPTAKF